MDDEELIGLYFGRDEKAIKATADKYGGRLRTLAYRLLLDNGDTDECLNDTLFKVWNAIPPNRPDNLYAFCATICRRTAINMLEKRTAQQRSAAVVELTAEMEQCIPAPAEELSPDEERLTELVNEFLGTLDEEKRAVFIRRYCFYETSAQIAEKCGIGESKVRVMLFRTRKRLKKFIGGKGVKL